MCIGNLNNLHDVREDDDDDDDDAKTSSSFYLIEKSPQLVSNYLRIGMIGISVRLSMRRRDNSSGHTHLNDDELKNSFHLV